jgi:hypothetical protein
MKVHKLTKGNSTVRFRVSKTDAEMRREVDGKQDTTTTALNPVEATRRMNELIRQGYKVVTGDAVDKKGPPTRKPVCFGTITEQELHLDLSLVPERQKAAARAIFVKHMNVSTDTVLVFNHEGGFVESVRPPKDQLLEIGMTLG